MVEFPAGGGLLPPAVSSSHTSGGDGDGDGDGDGVGLGEPGF